MPLLEKPIKLKWKTIEGIARGLSVAPVHVYLVAKAERQGREELLSALRAAEQSNTPAAA